MIEPILFNGKKYPGRLVRYAGETVLVSVETLARDLEPYDTLQSQRVDEAIFFYVPDTLIEAEEKELVEFIAKHVDFGDECDEP